MRSLLLNLFAFTVLFLSLTDSWADPHVIQPGTERFELGQNVEVAVVANGLTYAEIDPAAWYANDQRSINLGFISDAVWLRSQFTFADAQVENSGLWFLNLNTGNLREVDFYHYVDGQLIEHVQWWENQARLFNTTIDNNPSPGNKEGGLTTIYEKSLGAVAKARAKSEPGPSAPGR